MVQQNSSTDLLVSHPIQMRNFVFCWCCELKQQKHRKIRKLSCSSSPTPHIHRLQIPNLRISISCFVLCPAKARFGVLDNQNELLLNFLYTLDWTRVHFHYDLTKNKFYLPLKLKLILSSFRMSQCWCCCCCRSYSLEGGHKFHSILLLVLVDVVVAHSHASDWLNCLLAIPV